MISLFNIFTLTFEAMIFVELGIIIGLLMGKDIYDMETQRTPIVNGEIKDENNN